MASLAVSFISALNPLLSILSIICISFIFLRNKKGLFFILILLSFNLLVSYSVLITKNTGNIFDKKNSYTTPTSHVSIPLEIEVKAGQLIFGDYEKVPFNADGSKYSAGYYKLKQKYFIVTIPVISQILKFRNDTSDKLYLNSAGNLTITQAIMLGDKTYMDSDVRDKYIITGLAHFLAVSGLHTGVAAVFLITILSFLPYKFKLLGALIGLTLFVPLAGFKITVLRAYIIALAWMGAYIFDRKIRFRNLLLIMAGSFILINPFSVGDPSFLLSFSAVYGISCLPYEPNKPALSLIKAGVMASAFTLPFSLYFFGTTNPAGVLTTLIIVPVAYVHLSVGFLSLLFQEVSIEPLILLEKFQLSLIDKFYDYSYPFFTLHSFSLYYLIACLIFLYLIGKSKKYYWLAVFIFILPFIPIQTENGIYFINNARARGFIIIGEKNKVFYAGGSSPFIYEFVRLASKMGIKTFDEGYINIYGGSNNFLNIKKVTETFDEICVNNNASECPVVFLTSVSEIKKTKFDDKKLYIAYKFPEGINGVELKDFKSPVLKSSKMTEND